MDSQETIRAAHAWVGDSIRIHMGRDILFYLKTRENKHMDVWLLKQRPYDCLEGRS